MSDDVNELQKVTLRYSAFSELKQSKARMERYLKRLNSEPTKDCREINRVTEILDHMNKAMALSVTGDYMFG